MQTRYACALHTRDTFLLLCSVHSSFCTCVRGAERRSSGFRNCVIFHLTVNMVGLDVGDQQLRGVLSMYIIHTSMHNEFVPWYESLFCVLAKMRTFQVTEKMAHAATLGDTMTFIEFEAFEGPLVRSQVYSFFSAEILEMLSHARSMC